MGFAGELRLGFIVRIEGKFVGAFGVAEPFTKGITCTPTRRGPTFVRAKVGKTRLGLCPKTP